MILGNCACRWLGWSPPPTPPPPLPHHPPLLPSFLPSFHPPFLPSSLSTSLSSFLGPLTHPRVAFRAPSTRRGWNQPLPPPKKPQSKRPVSERHLPAAVSISVSSDSFPILCLYLTPPRPLHPICSFVVVVVVVSISIHYPFVRCYASCSSKLQQQQQPQLDLLYRRLHPYFHATLNPQ